MTIKKFENSVFSSITYVIADGTKAVIFDIGDTVPVFDYLEKYGLIPAALFITHTHYDHIYGIREFMTRFPTVPIYTSGFGKQAFRKPNWNFSRYHEDEISIDSEQIIALDNQDVVSLTEKIEVEVIATPGHDKSCLSYRIGSMLLTGDSYIPGLRIIASFPNSDRCKAAESFELIKRLAQGCTIYPGHPSPHYPSHILSTSS